MVCDILAGIELAIKCLGFHRWLPLRRVTAARKSDGYFRLAA